MIASQNVDPRARGRSLVLLGTGLGVVGLPVRGSEQPGRGIPDAAWLAVGEDPGVPTMDRGKSVVAEVSYPLEVEGRLDPQLSRWLWLVNGCWRSRISCVGVSVDRLLRAHLRCLGGDGLYRAISPLVVRVQCRRASLDVAGWLLHVRGAWHRPVSAVYPRPSSGLPGQAERRIPRAAVPGIGAGEVMAVGDTPVRDRRLLPGLGAGRASAGGFGCRVDRHAGPVRRCCVALHGPLSPGQFRPGGRA